MDFVLSASGFVFPVISENLLVHEFKLVLLLSRALGLEAFLSFYKEEMCSVRWIIERVVSIHVLLGLAENTLHS